MVDADCLIASVLTSDGATSRLIDRWQAGDFELVVCPQLVHEVRKALLSPRLAQRYEISESDANAFAGKLTEESLMTTDPKDDYLVALALETGLLVTRDRHFDKVAVEGLRILTPGEAIHLLDS